MPNENVEVIMILYTNLMKYFYTFFAVYTGIIIGIWDYTYLDCIKLYKKFKRRSVRIEN